MCDDNYHYLWHVALPAIAAATAITNVSYNNWNTVACCGGFEEPFEKHRAL